MTEDERYTGVQSDIKRLLDQAANDSLGGVVGFGAVLLAAKMYVFNEEGHQLTKAKNIDPNTTN
jgi:hypothetical protein